MYYGVVLELADRGDFGRQIAENLLYIYYGDNMKTINKDNFKHICNTSLTMAEAARKLNMHFNTFKRYAVLFGCYNPNQSGKNTKRNRSTMIQTEDILLGKYPDYNTYKLKRRLIREGYKQDKCEVCGWSEKRCEEDEFTPCELHHIDGNSRNHSLDNLIICCPNCHSLQNFYRSKNRADK